MCGIVGFISAYKNGFAYDEAKAFRDMVVVDSLRGFDSTGVYGVSNRGNVEIHKAAITGAEFVNTTEYQGFSSEAVMHGIFMVGHNRAATRGTVNDANAHPFWVDDNIILVQNGTYKGDHTHHKNTEVDTEAIAHVIAEHPDNIELALQKINAAYALVWYNVKDSTLYMIRNSERPMYLAYTVNDGIMFASEGETIMLAASRNQIKLARPPYLLADSVLFSWKLDTKDQTYEFDSKKVDCAYQHKHSPNNRSHVYSGYDVSGIWGSPSHRSHTRHYPQSAPGSSVNSTDITIHTYVYDGKFNTFKMSESEAKSIRDDLTIRPKDKPLIVQMTDYLAGNSHDDCKVWYVYGQLLQANDELPSPVMYSILFDHSEEDVINVLNNEFFSVTIPGSTIEHQIKEHDGTFTRIVTLFCTNATPVNVHAANENQAH